MNEITNEITNEIISEQYYSKVDFTNQDSIIYYGQNLLEDMSCIMDNTSVIIKPDDSDDFNVDDRLRKINNFGKYLEKSSPSEKLEKKFLAPVPVLIRNPLKEAKEKLFGTESYSTTFSEAYEEMNKDLDAVRDNIDFKAQTSMKRIEILKSYVLRQGEYVAILEKLIKKGESALEEYLKNNEEVKNTPQNPVYLFKEQLESLKEDLIGYKNSIMQAKIKINTDYDLLMKYKRFKTNVLSFLRNQATDMITTKKQRDDIEEFMQLKDIVNNVLKNNAKAIKNNVQKVNELKEKGIIETDTLKEMVKYTKEGLNLIQLGSRQEKLIFDKRAMIVSNISTELNDISEEVKNLTESKNNALTMKKEG